MKTFFSNKSREQTEKPREQQTNEWMNFFPLHRLIQITTVRIGWTRANDYAHNRK